MKNVMTKKIDDFKNTTHNQKKQKSWKCVTDDDLTSRHSVKLLILIGVGINV